MTRASHLASRARCCPLPARSLRAGDRIGAPVVDLNRNWPTGLTYVVAALGQLGRMEEAHAALTTYKELRPTDLASWERNARRLFTDGAAVDHIIDGLRKAGLE